MAWSDPVTEVHSPYKGEKSLSQRSESLKPGANLSVRSHLVLLTYYCSLMTDYCFLATRHSALVSLLLQLDGHSAGA